MTAILSAEPQTRFAGHVRRQAGGWRKMLEGETEAEVLDRLVGLARSMLGTLELMALPLGERPDQQTAARIVRTRRIGSTFTVLPT